MGLIKEQKKVDLLIKSEPWSNKELKEFSRIIKEQKAKRKKLPSRTTKLKAKQNT